MCSCQMMTPSTSIATINCQEFQWGNDYLESNPWLMLKKANPCGENEERAKQFSVSGEGRSAIQYQKRCKINFKILIKRGNCLGYHGRAMYLRVPSIKLPTVILQNNEKTRVIIIALIATFLLHIISVKPHSDFKIIDEPNQIYLLSTYSVWIGFGMALMQLIISSAPEMGDGL